MLSGNNLLPYPEEYLKQHIAIKVILVMQVRVCCFSARTPIVAPHFLKKKPKPYLQLHLLCTALHAASAPSTWASLWLYCSPLPPFSFCLGSSSSRCRYIYTSVEYTDIVRTFFSFLLKHCFH